MDYLELKDSLAHSGIIVNGEHLAHYRTKGSVNGVRNAEWYPIADWKKHLARLRNGKESNDVHATNARSHDDNLKSAKKRSTEFPKTESVKDDSSNLSDSFLDAKTNEAYQKAYNSIINKTTEEAYKKIEASDFNGDVIEWIVKTQEKQIKELNKKYTNVR